MTLQVFKWPLQFLMSSFFAFIVVDILNPRGSMETQILFMLATLPFAITAGIILSDISLYRTKGLSILAIITSMILSILGVVLSLLLIDVSHKISQIIFFIAYFTVLVLPPLVGYNFFSCLKRRKLDDVFDSRDDELMK